MWFAETEFSIKPLLIAIVSTLVRPLIHNAVVTQYFTQ